MMLGHLLVAAAVAAAAQGAGNGGDDASRLTAFRLTPATGAPTLDGRLDDAVWAAADSAGGFTQSEPSEGQPARFPTVVRVAFDHQAVYVAIRATDPQPDRIMAQLTRRDEDSSSDWLMVGFDSHHDRRTAYVFGVNPAGVKRDFILTDGGGEDTGWDAVWEVAVRRDDQGWAAEYRIPLSALRFASDGDGVWGFQVVRMVQREREQSWWAPMARDDSRVVARFGELHGMRGLPAPRRLELLPYSVSGVTRAPGEGDDPFYSATDWRGAVGLDVKYGVTSNLTLDATINPDFGQVEADPSQVNLSAYETFLAEKRPFFTEGAEIFRFGIGLGDGDGSAESLFYSRRVGRAPQGGADARGGWASEPTQTTILGAAKLSGRLPGGWSVGVLNALTAEERAAVVDAGGARHHDVVEPMTSYTVLRARRDLNGGNTQVGAVGTGVYRRLDETGLDFLRSEAFAGGVDFSHRWAKDTYLASAWVLGSTIRGSEEAIVRAQRGSARYFQRPDADYVQVDSSATSLSGWAASYQLMKVKGRWQGGLLGGVRSPGFEVNDVGFQRNADDISNVFWAGYREYQPGKVFRNFNLNTNLWNSNNFGWERTSLGGNVNGYGQLLGYWGVYGGLGHELETWNQRSLRGGPSIRAPGGTNGWVGFHGDGRKRLNGGADFSFFREAQTDGGRYSVSFNLGWRPTPSARLSVAPFYTTNRSAWQYVAQDTDPAGVRQYVFGALEQRTFGLSARVNQTFTPNLSLQVYAQPFVSSGRYPTLMRVADPRARRFGDRFAAFADSALAFTDDGETVEVDLDGDRAGDIAFDNPNFSVRDLNVNAVLRWEYRLGSTLYFAWSHSRSGSEPDGRFRPRDDFEALFREKPTNVFLIKMNWWLNL